VQETRNLEGDFVKEFFGGATEGELLEKMNGRLEVLKAVGHTLVRRVKIGRNDLCPCGSGIKFKKCCIDKVK